MKLRPALVAELAVNLLLPWAAYRLAQPHFGEFGGLIASAVPPLAWSIVELARFRRIDALSAIVLLGIALSIAAMALGGGPRMLLMRESLAAGVIGITFLVSLLARRPLVFYLARATLAREAPSGAARFEKLWNERPEVAASMRTLTAVWGLGLTVDAILRTWLATSWPIERFLIVSPLIGQGTLAVLFAWTIWYRMRMRRRHGERDLLGDPAAQ